MADKSLVVSCNRSNLKQIRLFVAEYLAEFTLGELMQNQLVLAVDEVCANFIIHSNKEDDTKNIKIKTGIQGRQLFFEISDAGKPYTPGKYQEPNLRDLIEQRRKGGVGILLVNRIMDKIEYAVEDGRNICRLYKNI